MKQKTIEVEAKATREAISIALKRLHAKKDEVNIRVLNEGTKGLFGLASSKKAKVKATIKRKK